MSAPRQAKKWRGMCVIAEYRPEDVLPHRGDHHLNLTVGDFPYSVQMDDSRYRVFAKSLSCVSCGLTGSLMRLEYNFHPQGQIEPHFNLYAVNPDNGTFILMTQDHIIPRAKGGTDEDDNLQTMCAPCNTKKGHKMVSSDGIEKFRAKNRDTLLNYLRNIIEGTPYSRSEMEELMVKLIDDEKVTTRFRLAMERAGWAGGTNAEAR